MSTRDFPEYHLRRAIAGGVTRYSDYAMACIAFLSLEACCKKRGLCPQAYAEAWRRQIIRPSNASSQKQPRPFVHAFLSTPSLLQDRGSQEMSAPLLRERVLQSTTRLTADISFHHPPRGNAQRFEPISNHGTEEGEARATCGNCRCIFVRSF